MDNAINIIAVDGVKLTLTSGDVLVVMFQQQLHRDQRETLSSALAKALPTGVNSVILDCGATVAAIKKE